MDRDFQNFMMAIIKVLCPVETRGDKEAQIMTEFFKLEEFNVDFRYRELVSAFNMLLDTAHIEEWKMYAGDRVYDRNSDTESIVISNLRQKIEAMIKYNSYSDDMRFSTQEAMLALMKNELREMKNELREANDQIKTLRARLGE